MDGFGRFAQGLTNTMNAIANQVIRASGKSVKNGGWPYFDVMFKEYPSFKRKFWTYQVNYHQATRKESSRRCSGRTACPTR
jgi:hypothetical protein